jgi:hypothetical protein
VNGGTPTHRRYGPPDGSLEEVPLALGALGGNRTQPSVPQTPTDRHDASRLRRSGNCSTRCRRVLSVTNPGSRHVPAGVRGGAPSGRRGRGRRPEVYARGRPPRPRGQTSCSGPSAHRRHAQRWISPRSPTASTYGRPQRRRQRRGRLRAPANPDHQRAPRPPRHPWPPPADDMTRETQRNHGRADHCPCATRSSPSLISAARTAWTPSAMRCRLVTDVPPDSQDPEARPAVKET